MLVKRRVVQYGAICLATFVVLCAVAVQTSGILTWGRMVVAPASLDGVITISTSPDKERTFITCALDHPTFLQRLFHSTLSCAFVVQKSGPKRSVVTHVGRAHIDFQGNLLSVDFADSSLFVFTIVPKGSIPLEEGEVDYVTGLATYRTKFIDTHAAFVASRDWTKRSCGL